MCLCVISVGLISCVCRLIKEHVSLKIPVHFPLTKMISFRLHLKCCLALSSYRIIQFQDEFWLYFSQFVSVVCFWIECISFLSWHYTLFDCCIIHLKYLNLKFHSIHSSYFYSTSSNPLLLRGADWYCVGVSRRNATGNCVWWTFTRSLLGG